MYKWVKGLRFNSIKDYNYYYMKMDVQKGHHEEKPLFYHILILFAKSIIFFLKDLKNLNFHIKSKNKILFYTITVNQKNALINLFSSIDNKKCFYYNEKSGEDINQIPKFLPTLFSIILIPVFLVHYYKSSEQDRKNIRLSKNDIMLSYGYYIYFLFLFKFSKPTMVIVSNDHLFQLRLLNYFCQNFNIPSVYIQHAPVTEKFPPLNFSLSLLEGEMSKGFYTKKLKSCHSDIKLIGMIKYDKYYAFRRKNVKINQLGISGNLLDDFEDYKDMIHQVHEKYPELIICFRPHPSILSNKHPNQYQSYSKHILSIPYLNISNPLKEDSFEYLSKIDLNIARNSGIHLDSVLMNVPTILYKSENPNDNYGFIKNKLVIQKESPQEIIDMIFELNNKKINIRDLAKPYVETVNTLYDGKSLELARKYILELIN